MPTFAQSVAAGGKQVGPGRSDPVEIVPWDPAWRRLFLEMRERIATALGETALRIDHVGSTAIDGLPAKPVVDIQVSVPDVEDEAAYKDAIEALGFLLRWIEPGHRYFRPPPDLPRLWQVHVCSVGSEWERVHLLFRDYLRDNPDVAAHYGALKMRLAAQHRQDRIKYTDEKGPFIEATLVAAENWANEKDWAP